MSVEQSHSGRNTVVNYSILNYTALSLAKLWEKGEVVALLRARGARE